MMDRFKAATMALLSKAVTSRVLSIRDPAHWRNRDMEEYTGEAITPRNVLSLSAVWACVNLLAGTLASLPMMVYRTRPDGAREVAKDHPLYRVLHDSPNSLQTALDFWEFTSASIELWGNGYARVLRNGDRTVGLLPVMPDLPQVEHVGNGRLRYRWSEDGRSFEEFSETMLHIRGFGGNPLGGMSTLSFGARAFGLALATDKAAASTFRNDMRPTFAIAYDKFLTDPQREAVEDGLQKKYVGASRAGKPFIAEGGGKLQTLSMKPEDAQMLESRGFSVEEISRFFGVPPFMIGHTSKSTSFGTGLSEQVLGFQKFALRRRAKRMEQSIEKQLLTPADRASGLVVEINMEGLLRGDSSSRASFYQSGLNNGWMTINEVRALENMPPVKGGDVPRMQSQNVPITEAGKQDKPEAGSPELRVIEGGK